MTSQNVTDLSAGMSYRRSIEPGRALMYACSAPGAELEPVIVTQEQVMGSRAYDIRAHFERQKTKNAAFDACPTDAVSPNPQRVEVAILPEDRPFLQVAFDVKYLPLSRAPNSCGSVALRKSLVELSELFAQHGGYQTLARRYLEPLVMGAWMWRNNDVASLRKIRIEQLYDANGTVWEFDLPIGATSIHELTAPSDQLALEVLATKIGSALAGDQHSMLALRVSAIYEIGSGMSVYPSQELNMDDSPKDAVKTSLYKVSTRSVVNQAAFTSQKIGNALRTIDVWHDNPEYGAIAVEPQGVVVKDRVAVRFAPKNDFYTLLRENLQHWLDSLRRVGMPAVERPEELLFVMAVLIKGGVFL
ncbi:type I-F CRISPR-associated protein Csy3 [Pseudomonas aeruginosa]